MKIEEELARLQLERISDKALCVRFEERQEEAIRLMAMEHDVPNAVIVRILVARGLRQS